RPHSAEEGVGFGVYAAELPLSLRAPCEATSADHGFGAVGDDVVLRTLGPVLGLEEEPLGLAALGPRSGQMPTSLPLLAVEDDVDVALAPLFLELPGRDRLVGAAVPDDAVPGSVFPVRDATLEVAVDEWVVLGLHGQALLGRVVARPLGGGPARQDAVGLEPHVVVETRGVVLVDHETRRSGRRACCAASGRRLRGAGKIALRRVGREWIAATGHGDPQPERGAKVSTPPPVGQRREVPAVGRWTDPAQGSPAPPGPLWPTGYRRGNEERRGGE